MVEGCDLPDKKRGYCENHYRRYLAHGDPIAGWISPNTRMPWLEAHVGYGGDDCLIWPFSCYDNGYGVMDYEGRHNAHRVMCILAHGEPPFPDADAAHNCGKGHLGCVNPRHLRWDTRKGNCADKVAHGTDTRGEQNPQAKITANDVRRIRALAGTVSQPEIAAMFGITDSNVSCIILRKSWAHIED